MPIIVDTSDLLENSKELEDVLKSLNQDGTHLWKVRSPSRWFRRKFTLDLKDMSMKYEPTSKSPCFSKNKHNIELGEIVEIRQGWKTDTFNKVEASEAKKKSRNQDYKGKVNEKASFSIIYGPRRDTWDLVAPSVEAADKWVRALNHLLSLYRSQEEKQGYERWLRKQFNSADIDKNKCLTFAETMRLLKQLNISMDEEEAMRLFDQANQTRNTKRGGQEVLDEDEFVQFYYKLFQRPDIQEIFSRYASSETMTASELCDFLQKEQGAEFASCSEKDCIQMTKIYEPSPGLKEKGEMSVSGFLNMLLSPQFDIFNGKHKVVYQDMNQPLSHYFIASSHNTYLVGNQLSGASSVEGYVEALKRGCRCVEFDCWDGENDEPIVYHGYTLTTKILFKEILSDAIKPYAFYASRYPLILSLENHCSPPYQQKMAEHFTKILGDMIYLVDPDENMKFLPSPEELQMKILIKAKKKSAKSQPPPLPNSVPPVPDENSSVEKIDFLADGDMANVHGVDDALVPNSPGYAGPPKASMESLDDSDSDPDESIDYIDGAATSTRKLGISNELSSLVNLIQAVHFHSFEDSRLHAKYYHMSSFSEAKANNFLEVATTAFVDYNKRQLSRIYPAGSRTSSSNFNPIPYWNVGCQIVALNYQTEDKANFYNDSLFRNNGSCGYILKPSILTNPETKFNPKFGPSENRQPVTLTVRLISGQHLPKAPGASEVIDPYVQIKILGIQKDRAKESTEVVHNNGFNPIWNQTFKFEIYCPELAMLYFRVRDYSQSGADMPIAHYALPVNSVTVGYRHIYMTSLKGVPLVPSSLLVHISKSEPDMPIK